MAHCMCPNIGHKKLNLLLVRNIVGSVIKHKEIKTQILKEIYERSIMTILVH